MNETSKNPLDRALVAIERLKKKLESYERQQTEPIAVVGMGCRFPGASDLDAYWALLEGGIDAVREVPAERGLLAPELGDRSPLRFAATLDEVGGFDAAFFGISPREAESLDPQQRLLLEVAWEAIEHAGLVAERLAGSRTGVFIGNWSQDYSRLVDEQDASKLDAYCSTGNMASMEAGRLSYTLGLHGPSVQVDTACSSSLVSVHLACQSLRSGDSEIALAGGVTLLLSPQTMLRVSSLLAFSPDGRCRTFDAGANGTVRGEGCGVVVLKRLSDAQRDGDRIWALIRGSAVNHDGRSMGLTAPNPIAQESLIRWALENARVSPAEIDYVEAHGTGTSLGDPIELDALRAVLGAPRADGSRCAIASVKTNIAHTEAAAGVAGLIKVVLALEHQAIPRHLHLRTLNPRITLEGTPFYIPTENTPWLPGARARRAGVSSFGLSGTNAHLIVEEPPRSPAPVRRELLELVPLSAKSEGALAASALRLATRCAEMPLSDVAFTAATRRTFHAHRAVVSARSSGELAEKLQNIAAGKVIQGSVVGVGGEVKKLVFVFPGQGGQWYRMGRELLETQPVFREAIARCEQALAPHVTWSLSAALSGALSEEETNRVDVVHPSVFGLQVGLAALLASWSIEPDAVVGLSMGEISAAFVAGALSLEDAAKIVALRSRLLLRVAGKGAMIATELSEAEAEVLLEGNRRVSVGAVNGERSTVLSGEKEAIDAIAAELEKRGTFWRRVKVDCATHCAPIEPLDRELASMLHDVASLPPRIPIYSTVAGARLERPLDGRYWGENLRRTVRFWDASRAIERDGHRAFLELNGHPTQLTPLNDMFRQTEIIAVGTLRREEPAQDRLLENVAALWAHGVPLDWRRICTQGQVTSLPNYPWERRRYWLEAAPRRVRGEGHVLLGREHRLAAQQMCFWESELSVGNTPFLADHRVEEACILPATAYVEMFLHAAQKLLPGGVLASVSLEEAMVLGDASRPLQLVATEDLSGWSLELSSVNEGSRRVHARAEVRRAENETRANGEATAVIRARLFRNESGEQFYSRLAGDGFRYGPAFRGIHNVAARDGEALAEIVLPEAAKISGFVAHPALLDACLQVLLAAFPSGELDGPLVPAAIASVEVRAPLPEKVWSHARLDLEKLVAEIEVLDDHGACLAKLRGIELKRLNARTQRRDDHLLAISLHAAPLEVPAKRTGARYLILADERGLGAELARVLEESGAGALCIFAKDEDATREGFAQRLREVSLAGVIHLWSFDEGAVETASFRDLGGALSLAQALAKSGARDPARFYLVTPAGSVRAALLRGFGRSLATEHPELRPTRIELGGTAGAAELAREILAASAEDELSYFDGVRSVARLSRVEMPESRNRFEPAGGRDYRLELDRPGTLAGLSLRARTIEPPRKHEVQLEIDAAGLNFRDVLYALGAVPIPEHEQLPLAMGGECCGRVVAVGEGVRELAIGDAVIALVEGSFATRVNAPATLVMKKPARLGAIEAASIPIAHLTAYWSLAHVARLRAGERVLIHAAAGGVGQAAIQYAKHVGAEIYATVSSPEKAALVRSLGVEHVSDSRSARFVEDVHTWTKGQGVDVVLNSLSGVLLEKSFGLLRDHGRFVELGKRDEHANARLGMKPFLKNLTFALADVSGVARQRPELARSVLAEVLALIEAGALAPIPHTALPLSQAEDAFQLMAQGRHTGKIVLTRDGLARIETSESIVLSSEGRYLIVGGLGGLGLSLARWMIAHGARDLVLAGRSGAATDEQRLAVRDLEMSGARVEAVVLDVSSREDVKRLIERLGPTLRGVVHAAVVLEDALIEEQSIEKLARVVAPKVFGAWHLHELTASLPLDFFVLYSSAAALLGTPGQSGYAAANAFLDALAHHRRGLGLPALSINWGAFSGAGLAVRGGSQTRLEGRGLGAITPDEGNAMFERLLGVDRAQIGVVPLDVHQWVDFYPQLAASPFWAELLEKKKKKAAGASDVGVSRILEAPPAERAMLIERWVEDELGRVLRLDPRAIGRTTPFQNMGLDSLTGLELRNRLERALRRKLPATLVWTYPDVARLGAHLLELAGGPIAEAPRVNKESEALDRLSDDELASFGEQLLS
jgi:acyl transferase domain-containing protein/short-subunit dehydrogenase